MVRHEAPKQSPEASADYWLDCLAQSFGFNETEELRLIREDMQRKGVDGTAESYSYYVKYLGVYTDIAHELIDKVVGSGNAMQLQIGMNIALARFKLGVGNNVGAKLDLNDAKCMLRQGDNPEVTIIFLEELTDVINKPEEEASKKYGHIWPTYELYKDQPDVLEVLLIASTLNPLELKELCDTLGINISDPEEIGIIPFEYFHALAAADIEHLRRAIESILQNHLAERSQNQYRWPHDSFGSTSWSAPILPPNATEPVTIITSINPWGAVSVEPSSEPADLQTAQNMIDSYRKYVHEKQPKTNSQIIA